MGLLSLHGSQRNTQVDASVAWSHKIAQVLQEGRVYVLDTGQKVHFERLKPHNSGPNEWATIPTNNGDVAVITDPEPEQSLEKTPEDASQPSYREEELVSEASNNSQPPRQRYWMDTRLPRRTRAEGTRRFYQQFGSSTDTDEKLSVVFLSSVQADTNEVQELGAQPETLPPIEIPLTPTIIPENLFSEHEMIEARPSEQETQQPVIEIGTSSIGTSAPL